MERKVENIISICKGCGYYVQPYGLSYPTCRLAKRPILVRDEYRGFYGNADPAKCNNGTKRY